MPRVTGLSVPQLNLRCRHTAAGHHGLGCALQNQSAGQIHAAVRTDCQRLTAGTIGVNLQLVSLQIHVYGGIRLHAEFTRHADLQRTGAARCIQEAAELAGILVIHGFHSGQVQHLTCTDGNGGTGTQLQSRGCEGYIRCTGTERQPGTSTQIKSSHRHGVGRTGCTRAAESQRGILAEIQRRCGQILTIAQLDGSTGTLYGNVTVFSQRKSLADFQRAVSSHGKIGSIHEEILLQVTVFTQNQIACAGNRTAGVALC